MCHRQRDWSRTSSRASESEDERETERAPWTARAKNRLVAFVSAREKEVKETPERPTMQPEMARSETVEDAEMKTETEDESETEDEREEGPIPADD